MRLIDADALRKAVNDFYDNSFEGIVSSELIKYAKAVDDYIDNAPTIEEHPKGKWRKRNGYVYDYRCSCCEYIIYNGKTNFCPNCGADMRGNE